MIREAVIEYASEPNFDPFERRGLLVALVSSELAVQDQSWLVGGQEIVASAPLIEPGAQPNRWRNFRAKWV